ncbi:recombinase family protein [Nonomuraea sp. NPDC050153]|uniref:recombinase family protein n=1 Tax=Nonomuraea sp. NPDC050153 TaxID=3364359 RepID=UPI00379F83F9
MSSMLVRHILTEAGLLVRTEGVAEGFRPAEGVLPFEDPATTSKIPALERPAFAKVAAAAHPGDILIVSELFRLCRDLVDSHAARGWCQARGVALRVLSGPLVELPRPRGQRRHDSAAHQRHQRRRAVPTRPAKRADRRRDRHRRSRRPLPRPTGARLEEVRSAFQDDG